MKKLPLVSTLALVLSAPAHAQNIPDYKTGFPATLTGPGGNGKGNLYGHAVVADLGLSPGGKKSIVFGTAGGRLYVVRFDGTVAPGWPITLPSSIQSAPAVADLDGNGQLDIVVGFGTTFDPGLPGGFRAYRSNGTLLWSRTTGDFDTNAIPDGVVSSPAIGDVDGDGALDVALGGFDANVYLVRGDTGADKPGWPIFVRDTIWSSPALHDIDGDGKPEVVIGVDAHTEPAPHNTLEGGYLHVYRANGSEVAGFPRHIDQTVFSAPAVGDIDGDGKPEIVVGTGTFYPGKTHAVYAFRCDGSNQPGWPAPVDGEVFTAPALANLDGDAALEVVFTDNSSGADGKFHVYGFKGNGTRIFKTAPQSFFGTNSSARDPVVADVLGDGAPEILVATNTEVAVFSAAGAQLTAPVGGGGAKTFYTQTALAGALVADFENDGIPEVVAISGTPFPSATNTEVHVWNPKGTATPAPWGMLRRDARHDGTMPGTQTCAFRYGDLNNDAVRDVFDVVTLAAHLVGNSPAGTPPFVVGRAAADVNRDGKYDIFDLVQLAGFIVGNVPYLPI